MHRNAMTLAALLAAPLAAQQAITIPASADLAPANSRVPARGTVAPSREQNILSASHLTAVDGKQISALVLRRDETASDSLGGSLRITIRLSTAPHGPLDAQPLFAGNHGGDVLTVFSGDVALPVLNNAGAQPGWTGSDVLRIPFTTPFPYSGGDLTVDISSEPTPGVTNDPWDLDAVQDSTTGSIQDLGPGCGSYASNNGRWVLISPESLVVGETPAVVAMGSPGGPALHVLSTTPMPYATTLSMVDGQPCFAHVANWFFQEIRGFVPQPAPLNKLGGIANTALQIPNQSNLLGASFVSQWVDINQGFATSNAVRCTIAGQVPGIGMSRIYGDWVNGAEPNAGVVNTRCGTVMRFETL